jgi:hypothetical protein
VSGVFELQVPRSLDRKASVVLQTTRTCGADSVPDRSFLEPRPVLVGGYTAGHKARGENGWISLGMKSNALDVEYAVRGAHDVFRKTTAAADMQS